MYTGLALESYAPCDLVAFCGSTFWKQTIQVESFTKNNTPHQKSVKQTSGISGLDDLLRGGFPTNRLYVVEGDPGAGKTTLAMQFLLEGLGLFHGADYAFALASFDIQVQAVQAHGVGARVGPVHIFKPVAALGLTRFQRKLSVLMQPGIHVHASRK